MFEAFDDAARAEVIEGSQREARRLGHNFVGTEHLLLAIVAAEEEAGAGPLLARGLTHERVAEAVVTQLGRLWPGTEADALRAVGVEPERIEAAAKAQGADVFIQGLTPVPPPPAELGADWLAITPRVKAVLQMAHAAAQPNKVATHDILLAVLDEGAGLADIVIEGLGVSPECLAEELRTQP